MSASAPGRARLNALPAERARGVAEHPVELRDDLCVEATIHDVDGVVALLLGTDPHTAVAGDAEVIVPQDERIVVPVVTVTRLRPLEASGASRIAIDEVGQLLRGVSPQGIHIELAILRGNELEQNLAKPLDLVRSRLNRHPVCRLGGARGDGISSSVDVNNAQSTTSESVQASVVTEARNLSLIAAGDLVNRFARRERHRTAVKQECPRIHLRTTSSGHTVAPAIRYQTST